ncbi:hypothetical protein P691DRAFT_812722 [Macrolepiota fuliginosa MF-IS2]|uniref:Pheromone n=1 Tax=Macrolepiota fuliginosa MF-IS2 TaxID=1400762 RepID=A0A9P5X0R4_9AGAR|nr:hypothetical protein P691DRAFT_812722 [Macrolepiota fuliginosa MF-IS2]
MDKFESLALFIDSSVSLHSCDPRDTSALRHTSLHESPYTGGPPVDFDSPAGYYGGYCIIS